MIEKTEKITSIRVKIFLTDIDGQASLTGQENQEKNIILLWCDDRKNRQDQPGPGKNILDRHRRSGQSCRSGKQKKTLYYFGVMIEKTEKITPVCVKIFLTDIGGQANLASQENKKKIILFRRDDRKNRQDQPGPGKNIHDQHDQ